LTKIQNRKKAEVGRRMIRREKGWIPERER